jgi:hypothetical protein
LLTPLTFLVVDWKIPALLLIVRILLQVIIVGKSASKLKEKDLIPFIPLLEMFLVFVHLSIFISNSRSKQIRWK